MDVIKNIAEQMLVSQSFEYNSFREAMATIEQEHGEEKLYVKYDRLSLCVYEHNLTSQQYWLLGEALDVWYSSSNSEMQKERIEYAILCQYATIHPEYLEAQVKKTDRPDFTVNLNDETIGIEITRLEKQCDNVMTRIISDCVKPGMTTSEIYAAAFKKHGYKANEYMYTDFGDDCFAIQHNDDMLISTDDLATQIETKIEKYRSIASGFDKFIVLCNAQLGIAITSRYDAQNLIDRVLQNYTNLKMSFAVIYLTADNVKECLEQDS